MSAAPQTQINHEVKEQKLQKDITMTFISWKGSCFDRYCCHNLYDKIRLSKFKIIMKIHTSYDTYDTSLSYFGCKFIFITLSLFPRELILQKNKEVSWITMLQSNSIKMTSYLPLIPPYGDTNFKITISITVL